MCMVVHVITHSHISSTSAYQLFLSDIVMDHLDQRFNLDDPDFDFHFHPLSDIIVPSDNLADINHIMALAVRYSTSLATGSLNRQARYLETAAQAISFANHWQDLCSKELFILMRLLLRLRSSSLTIFWILCRRPHPPRLQITHCNGYG